MYSRASCEDVSCLHDGDHGSDNTDARLQVRDMSQMIYTLSLYFFRGVCPKLSSVLHVILVMCLKSSLGGRMYFDIRFSWLSLVFDNTSDWLKKSVDQVIIKLLSLRP